ncbi:MAG: hypothetical protein ACRDYV_17545 [Acidimicrobiia bacterium]
MTPAWLVDLLAEVDGHRFCPVAEQVGQVRQRAEELVVPVGKAGYPVTARLAAALHAAASPRSPRLLGLERFVPNEAVYLRYRGRAAGISPHRDHKRYAVLIAVFTLLGEARLSVVADRAGEHVLASWLTAPGDLFLLRASGFGGDEDRRPLHAVGPPTGYERVSLTLRMDTRRGWGSCPTTSGAAAGAAPAR